MTKRWYFNEFETHAALVSALLSSELRYFHVCSATRSIGSVIQLKVGPLHEAIDAGDTAAARAYSTWEWAIFVDFGNWSLRKAGEEIVSSNATPQEIEIGLGQLNGRRLSAVTLLTDGGLDVSFSGEWELCVPVENIAKTQDEGQWTIFRKKDWALTYGQGLSLEVYGRDNHTN